MTSATHQAPKKSGGLDGVSIGTTVLSDVDGERGRLTIAGHDVEALAARHSFEEAALLLLEGSLPDAAACLRFHTRLAAGRRAVHADLSIYGNALRRKNPLESLRAAVAMLEEGPTFPATASLVLAAIPVFIGGWYHQQRGTVMPVPHEGHSTAEALLHFLDVPAPTRAIINALNGYLLTVSDHGMNASTFTARVIASTQSDTISAVTGAIGALKGPLHGGAPGPVLAMLDEISSSDRAAAWIRNKLAKSERIMGMGHRINRVRDPRAAVFERLLQDLDDRPATAARLALARTVEREAERQLAELKPDRPLKANVEFYTAVLLEACGIPGELFTSVFAAGRAAGWLAHIKEQKETGRLIRPSVDYVGAGHVQSIAP